MMVNTRTIYFCAIITHRNFDSDLSNETLACSWRQKYGLFIKQTNADITVSCHLICADSTDLPTAWLKNFPYVELFKV
jgi:hypothetical protein